MSVKKIIVALLIIVVAVGGFVAGLILLQERQVLEKEAAVPTGEAKVTITPETGNYGVGDTIATSIYFNPANIAISGVAVRLSYPFSGATPEVSVTEITVNSTLLSTGDWTCPTQNSTQQGGNVVIDIACAHQGATGFLANTDTLFANVSLKVNRAPATSPLVVRFDPALSVITRKSDNQDVLLIPQSTGSYTIAGAGEASPTPEVAIETETPTPTAVATATPTSTPSATITVSPTAAPVLDDAGVSYPTVLGLGLGVLAIIAAFILAF